MQKDLKECIVRELKPIREEMKNLPKSITFPQFPSITAYGDYGEEDAVLGDIAEQYLSQIRRLDCGIRMASFTLGARKQK